MHQSSSRTGTSDVLFSQAEAENVMSAAGNAAQGQMGLFQVPAEDDAVRRRLRSLDVNEITPMQALTLLAELKDEAGE